MKKLSIIVLMLSLGLGSIQNAHAQLGKLGKKVSNKVKTEERKAKKTISNTKKTGKLPKTGGSTTPSVKTPNTGNTGQTPTVGANVPSKPAVGGLTKEEDCKGATTNFRTAYKQLGKILNPQEGAEELSISEMEATIKQVKTVWLKQIKDRDPSCDTSNLEDELAKAEEYVKEKKGGAAFLAAGTYTTTGVWENVEFSAMEFEKFTNKQAIKLNGPLGNLEGYMVQKATGDDREAVAFDIEGLGQGAILPYKDAAGNIQYHQMAVIQNQKPVAIILFSNTKSREELEQAMDQRTQERLEKENLDPFVKNNLGKIVISTQGPIYKNGKVDGQAGGTDIKLTDSIELGQPLWVRMIIKDHKPAMNHLAFTGYPPAGEIGAAIRTRIFFDGEEVGQDLLRCTKQEDVEIVTNATSYREKGFDPKDAAQDAYREGFEGIFAKNPGYGEHTMEIKKFVVNYNVVDTGAGEGEEKFPLEVLLAESGPIKVIITENSWKPFCNSGENNYGPTTGVVNSYSKSILTLAKKEAARAGWKEKPFACFYTGKYEKRHEVTGVHMYTVYKGAVKSRMPNGSIIEQEILMADGAFYGVGSGTYRYLPPKCN